MEHNIDAQSSDDNSIEYAKQLARSNSYSHAGKIALVQGLNRPLFHIDLTSALQSAIRSAEQRDDGGVSSEAKSHVQPL